ncbi:PREDICTED: putative F-box protein At3g10430 [Fragaria vesca subsp. vesca]|uniref:putative F-box protein At3g10430 n=1 Tax=Fragaria vesca subsp. vesca TaxID=101020 RepID=UPI0002C3702F|nr:PREDICTED: putative F-box protein At3g10430 [Fragaria vesca subsp. vesca]
MEARQVVNVSSSLADSQDLVIEVLSRLPIESLLRFMSVSQECFKHTYDKPHKISMLGKEDTHLVALDLPEGVQHDKLIHIAGSSNGLVCLHPLYTSKNPDLYNSKEKIVVWNPATRKHRYLPQPLAFKGQKESTLDRPLLGFGFNNDNAAEYKVVRISRSMDPDADGKFPYLTQVFTRTENSWREVDCVPPRDYHFDSYSSISSNGVLYRLARTKSDRFVFSFDLHDEVVHTMPMPPRFSPSFRCIGQQLFTWENSVAILTYDEGQYDLWVMKKVSGT